MRQPVGPLRHRQRGLPPRQTPKQRNTAGPWLVSSGSYLGHRSVAALQRVAVDERVGQQHDVRRHAVLKAQAAHGVRVRGAQAREQRHAHAGLARLPRLDDGLQLVVVAHQYKRLCQAQRAHAHGLRDLAGLVHDAHVEAAARHQRVRDAETGGGHDLLLQQHCEQSKINSGKQKVNWARVTQGVKTAGVRCILSTVSESRS
jgi:hypothetical protein